MLHNRWSVALFYVYTKLFGAGIVFLLFSFITSGFDLYELSARAHSSYLWWAFFGYAIAFSVFVDLIMSRVKRAVKPTALLLYFFGGYAPFLVIFRGDIALILISGSVGALCALVYYGAVSVTRGKEKYTGLAAIVLLLGLTVLAGGDFTAVKEWTDIRTTHSYEAKFAYFNGKKDIHIEAPGKHRVTFSINWSNNIEGGYGMYVLDTSGKRIAMENTGSFQATRNGRYTIVITGDDLKGSFKVEWSL